MESRKSLSERFFARLKIPTLPVLLLAALVGCSDGGNTEYNPQRPTSSLPSNPSSSLSSSSAQSSSVSSDTLSSVSSDTSSSVSSDTSSSISSDTSSSVSSDVSSEVSSSSSSVSPSTLQGKVSVFPSAETAQSKTVVRKSYDPSILQQSGALPSFQAPGDGGETITRDDMVPARALVSLFLLSDVDYADPIATVPTDENGNYNVTVDDVRDYLLTNNLIPDGADEDTIITAFRALGKLQVRAVVIREENGAQTAMTFSLSQTLRTSMKKPGYPSP